MLARFLRPREIKLGMGILELWNSRSSFRSVWPRSPYRPLALRPLSLLGIAGAHLGINVNNDVVALSIRHCGLLVFRVGLENQKASACSVHTRAQDSGWETRLRIAEGSAEIVA